MKNSRVKKDMGEDFDYDDYAENKAPMVLNKLRDAVSILPSYLTATSVEYGLMIGEYIIDIESGKNLESRDNFNEVCQVLESAISMYVQYFEIFIDYDDEHHLSISLKDNSVPGGDSLYASTKKSKMRKSVIAKNEEGVWDAVSSPKDARFIQEVIDNGNLIEEYDADEDGSKVHVKIYSYDYERYRVVYVDDYPPFMQYDEANVFWKDRKHWATKKMRKGMDIDGVFDDSYQKPHGKYVLHLNLNGDSFYPKYFDDEESFNREVQRAIDNGYTESDWSNYSDNEGLHRRFARDDWGKSAKKSYTPDYMDFRSMVDSIKNTGNHNKVFKE